MALQGVKILRVFIAFFVSIWCLSSCSYANKQWELSHVDVNRNVDYVIQLDDVGQFWDREYAEKALRDVSSSSRKTNTIVVVFIHGWHNNAAPDNQNLADFSNSLAEVRKQLSQDPYPNSRHTLTGISDFRVIGIYVGWRGRSLPGIADYSTFWSRKAAAERVGDGDIREFLTRLNQIYNDENSNAGCRLNKQMTVEECHPFMGLAAFGHSFGGQVLFKAVRPAFEAELLSTGAAEVSGQVVLDHDHPLHGFGDMVVLVNPALEALQFDRIHSLAAKIKYPYTQPPLLLVLTAEDDAARGFWFPMGRFVDSIFRAPLRPDIADKWDNALGSYEPQQTHEIAPVGVVTEAWEFDPDVYKYPCKVLHFDLSNTPIFLSKNGSGIRLVPKAGRSDPYNPFLVANVSSKMIEGHTGIWLPVFRSFLNNYVAVAEGKRILERARGDVSCN
jgi:hypothetical protein